MSIENSIVGFPLSDITTPKDGCITYVGWYWLTKDGNAFKAKHYGTLQCNKDKRVVELVYKNLIADGYEVTHIPVAYVNKGGE